MVTKLKNSRKCSWILIFAVVLICAAGMTASYSAFSGVLDMKYNQEEEQKLALEETAKYLTEGNYFLYNEIEEVYNQDQIMSEYGDHGYFLLNRYVDYIVLDYNGKRLLGTSNENVKQKLLSADTEYLMRILYLYGSAGELQSVKVLGKGMEEQEMYELERIIYSSNNHLEEMGTLDSPTEIKVVCGISTSELKKYMNSVNYSQKIEEKYVDMLSDYDIYRFFLCGFLLIIVAAAIFIPFLDGWKLKTSRVFHAPFEAVPVVWLFLLVKKHRIDQVVWDTLNHRIFATARQVGLGIFLSDAFETVVNMLMWFAVFLAVYWGVTCLHPEFTLKKAYWEEQVLCVRLWKWMNGKIRERKAKRESGTEKRKHILRELRYRIQEFFSNIYDDLVHLDLRDKTIKAIGKALIVNIIVLCIVGCFWEAGVASGILALLVYSAILFVILRKYFLDVQRIYEKLLKATELIAEGNLDVPLEEDMGIFNPVKEKIREIQKGFKKAVEEEVKSERMKTELVTNVSHDLKTPLTAIITYTDLLKSEKDPEKQKEYLDVLEKKSLRLKVLIEDLFEISKASSRNVTMHYVNVDIVGLLKQDGLEYDSQIKAANLEIRWRLPEEKVILLLDSQKTYRIFENLILNITKYAMPHTRVYISMTVTEKNVVISMKNVSAAEMDFDVEEITDRFVRGDASRNTEGSGLGLAIAKSFTELQDGKMTIYTEADLFKVEIVFPRKASPAGGQD